MTARLTEHAVGCWVVKSRRLPTDIVPDWPAGEARTISRCLHRNYRGDLMRSGQRCLLWVSGAGIGGVHAIGTLAGAAEVTDDGQLAVRLTLLRLTEPLPRAELRADPEFADAEVLRVPVGSNPSYLTADHCDALVGLLAGDALRSAGWS